MSKRDVVVLGAARSAIGTFGGALSDMEPAELAGTVMKEAIKRSGVDPKAIHYVTVGNTIPTEGRFAYVARVAAIQAGLPMDSVAMSVNRLCSSGLQGIVTTAQNILLGDCDYGIGGGVEVMSRGGREVDGGLGLVVAGDLRAEDRIPDEAVSARQIDHQGDVAVRARCQPIAAAKSGQSRLDIRPCIQSMPGEVEFDTCRLVDLAQLEAIQHHIEVAPMQRIELAEGQPPAADFFHRRLILVAPSVGERVPVERDSKRREGGLHFSGDASAPVDQRAEYVEDESLDRHALEGCQWRLALSLSRAAAISVLLSLPGCRVPG